MSEYRQYRLTNMVHTALLLIAMGLLLGFIGYLVAGTLGLLMISGFGVAAILFSPNLSTQMVMRISRARPLRPGEGIQLQNIVSQLARRAELKHVPRLYYMPSREMNAFATGTRDDAAIAVSDGLLRVLDTRELIGVLAHEVSHLRNNDVRVMGMAALASRMTRSLSFFGQLMLLLSLPLMLMGQARVPFLMVMVLIAAPILSGLLQLALSRTREFDADMGAVRLTGDPHGLASALQKLDCYRGGFWQRVFTPFRYDPGPAWLRTHPATGERIRRLLSLETYAAPVGRQNMPQPVHSVRFVETANPGYGINVQSHGFHSISDALLSLIYSRRGPFAGHMGHRSFFA